jgi:two-component system cell cycle sensor histidine kinase/response regulator CckA
MSRDETSGSSPPSKLRRLKAWLLRALGTGPDVTERGPAGQALDVLAGRGDERERMLTMTLTFLGDFAYTYDRDGRFLFVNQPLLDLWGITLEQAVGKNFSDLGYPPDLAAKLQGEVQQVIDTRRSVTGETAFTSPAGVTGFYEYIFSPVLGEGGAAEFVVGSSRNITERKHASEALRASLEEFRALAEAIPQMLWAAGPDGSNVYCNPQWMEYTGLTLGESLGREWSEVASPDDRDRIAAAWRRALSTGENFSQECRLRRADGEFRWWLVRSGPVRDDDGAVRKWFGTCTDVHDLRVAERERADAEGRLLRSAEAYRVLFEGNPHAMWVFDAETLAFLAVNDAAVRLYGFSRDEFGQMTIKDIRPPEEIPGLLEYLATIPDTPGLVATQTRHRRKDGSPMEVDGISNPIEFQGRRARLVMAQDATEKKQLEAQLMQALKMEAVGRLAGGVAHDFNNSLGVILGYTERLIREGTEAQRAELQQILKATQRASGLTRQLLAFSRKQVVSPQVVDLNALLADLEEMLARLLGEHIRLEILPGPGLGHVVADPGQLQQVVMNLCVNARDAMPEGGLLRLETDNADLGTGPAGAQEPIAAGRYVRLAVTDAGVGIAKELHSKIFEPFFTTKELGEGTGLGLAMVYGIVKQAGGHVWVGSDVGRGTTFTIYLPRTDEPLVPEVKAAPPTARGWETILLTEDEGALREISREILEEHGYRVLEAAGPSAALALERERPEEPIHLLLTDVVMPGMNGRVLADALRTVRPDLKVLYISGYTDDILAHSGVLATGTLLLQKPFTTSALLGRVREALDRDGLDPP